jgi:hypothetical protein
MADSAKKILATMEFELKQFKDSEEAKELSVSETQDRILLIRQKYGEKVMALLQKEDAEFQKQQEALLAEELKLQETRDKTLLQSTEDAYRNQEISYQEYLDTKKKLAIAHYDRELAILNQKLAAAGLTPDKKAIIEIKIKTTEEEKEAAVGGLTQEGIETRLAAEREMRDEINIIRQGLAETESERMAAELEAYDIYAKERYARFEKLISDEEELKKLADAQDALRKKKEKDLEKQVLNERISVVRSGLGYMESLFADMYEASGKEMKQFFYLQKAVAVADAIVSTYAAANKAMNETPGPGWVKMAMAATIVASGIARVAQIIATTIKAAEGGFVQWAGTAKRTFTSMGATVPKFAQGGDIRIKGTTFKGIPVRRYVQGGLVSMREPLEKAGRPIRRFSKGGPSGLREPVRRLTRSNVVVLTKRTHRFLDTMGTPVQRFARGGPAVPLGPALPSPTRLPSAAPGSHGRVRPSKTRIPAWLTDREYVMSPEAVRHYGPNFMKSINEMRVPVERIVNQIRNQTEVRPVRHTRRTDGKPQGPAERLIRLLPKSWRVQKRKRRKEEEQDIVQEVPRSPVPRLVKSINRMLVPVEKIFNQTRRQTEVRPTQYVQRTDEGTGKPTGKWARLFPEEGKLPEGAKRKEEQTVLSERKRSGSTRLVRTINKMMVPAERILNQVRNQTEVRPTQYVREVERRKERPSSPPRFVRSVNEMLVPVERIFSQVKHQTEVRPTQYVRRSDGRREVPAGPSGFVKSVSELLVPVEKVFNQIRSRTEVRPAHYVREEVGQPVKLREGAGPVFFSDGKALEQTVGAEYVPVPEKAKRKEPHFVRTIREATAPVDRIVNQIRNQTEVRPVRTAQSVLTKVAEPVQHIITNDLLQRVVEQEPTKRIKKPRGGQIRGAPGIDKIPAWLTDKEYVIRAEAVRHYGVAFMEMLNRRMLRFNKIVSSAGEISRPGVYARRFQEGGYTGELSTVDRGRPETGGTTGTTINVPVEITTGDMDFAGAVQDTVEDALQELLREYT